MTLRIFLYQNPTYHLKLCSETGGLFPASHLSPLTAHTSPESSLLPQTEDPRQGRRTLRLQAQ